jgi:[calcium/calmodulin-dependent protein kinase] kinase
MSPSRAPFKEWRGSPRNPQVDNTGENLAQHMLVKESNLAVLSQDSNGNKMINEYVRECKIGTGSYGKVVLHRSKKDGKQYAIKMFHKSRLRKLRVSPTETAMMDVLREVAIMKQLDHPNVVHLVEVIDDPENDRFYMGLFLYLTSNMYHQLAIMNLFLCGQ